MQEKYSIAISSRQLAASRKPNPYFESAGEVSNLTLSKTLKGLSSNRP